MLLRPLLVLLACLSLAFAVTPAQAQQVQLTWDAPWQANGTPIPNLAGYKLYYGLQSGQYQTMVPVGLTTTYTVTNLSTGQTYYFAITAYNTTGMESSFSNEISVTLPTSPPATDTIPQQQMRAVSVDSQELVSGNYAATNVLDRNSATFWITERYLRTPLLPHTLVLDLGGRYQVDGWRYLPRQDDNADGTIAGYQVYVSDDGITWGTPAATGTFAANTAEKTVRFTAQTGRYVRLVALSEIHGLPYTSAAELNIFGTAAPSSTTTTASQASTQTASATVSSLTSSSSLPTITASQNTRWEMALTSTKTYANPFMDVTVTVEYTQAGAPTLRGYGFWDGGHDVQTPPGFPSARHLALHHDGDRPV